ncbi:MAG: hypothetical protein Kow0065_24490 [Methylomicrobium sp.]
MKKIISLLALLTLAVTTQNSVAEEHPAPADKPKHEMKMGKGMPGMKEMQGMGGEMGGMDGMDHGKMREHLKMKQEYQLKLHDLTNKILAEKDPAKQQALKDEQLNLMEQHHMHMMKMHKMKMMKGHKM